MESSIDDMKNKINHIKDYTFECDFGKGGVRLIKNTAQKQDIFDGFTGEYHAFNAPLSLEASKLEYHVNIHVNRYKNPEFKVAHYYYPILSSMPSTKKEVWVKNIYKLFQKVASKLNDEEKAKLKFYVPKTENKIAYTQLATYFYGERMKTEVCIMYLHNEASSILEIYDETALEEIRVISMLPSHCYT